MTAACGRLLRHEKPSGIFNKPTRQGPHMTMNRSKLRAIKVLKRGDHGHAALNTEHKEMPPPVRRSSAIGAVENWIVESRANRRTQAAASVNTITNWKQRP
jgi:hypothetical protein